MESRKFNRKFQTHFEATAQHLERLDKMEFLTGKPFEEQFNDVPGLEVMYDPNEDVFAASFYICPSSRNNFAVIAITDSVFPDVKYGYAVGNEEKTNPQTGKSGEVVIVLSENHDYFVAELSINDASKIPVNKMDLILKHFYTKARSLQFKINRK